MARTFERIATTTTTTSTASVEFTNISGAYKDLHISINASNANNASTYLYLRANGQTGSTDYYTVRLFNISTYDGDEWGQDTRSANELDVGYMPGTNGSGYGHMIINLFNYSDTNMKKVLAVDWNSEPAATGTRYALIESGSLNVSGAVTSLLFAFSGANIASGSTFTLYGIAE